MKLTKSQIKQLIKEELQNVLRSRRRLHERVDTEAILMQHVEDQLKPIKGAIQLMIPAIKALINAVDAAAMKQGKASPLARSLKGLPSWLQP
jgi:hypothetical protein